MHICMILREYYPLDIRVYKEALALTEVGYKITLLCLRKPNEKKKEKIHNMDVIRLGVGKNKKMLGLWDIYISLFKIHPVYIKYLKKIHKSNPINVIHIHDLYLMPTGIHFSKNNKLNVVCDFHENLPEAFKIWFSWSKNPLIKLKNSLFFGYKKWINIEKKVAHDTDYIITTVEEMKERFVNLFQVNHNKIQVLLNTELKSFINQPLDLNIYEGDNWFRITYTGNIGPHRGVDTVIQAMQYLKELPICLYIIGNSSKSVNKYLNQLIEKYGVENQVKRKGFVPFEQFYSYMKLAQVNIIPHKSNGHTDCTVPHKLFQAMLTGNPVLVSSSAPLARIVKKCDSGVVFKAGNALDLSEKIKMMLSDSAENERMGMQGLKSTLEGKWNWETTSELLVNFYNRVINNI